MVPCPTMTPGTDAIASEENYEKGWRVLLRFIAL